MHAVLHDLLNLCPVNHTLVLAVIILVGNKSDLTEQREVTTESGQEYAER